MASYFFQATAEALKHPLHVATFFHGDDPGVVFLIDPDEKRLVEIMPDRESSAELRTHGIKTPIPRAPSPLLPRWLCSPNGACTSPMQ